MFDSFGLLIAYLALGVLLLVVLVYSRAPILIKGGLIVLVSAFYYVTYLSVPDFFGWPTPHHTPKQLQIVAIHVDAPNKIYFWGHDLQDGAALKRPRAYEFDYTANLYNSINKASNKLKKGFPMIGEFRPVQTPVSRVGEGETREPQDRFELILFDVPEALLPGEKK